MAAGLERRGQRIIALRNHAKIILARTTAGHDVAIEASANLRSCRNLEVFSLSNDAGLFEFHRDWMARLFKEPQHGS
jgi:hypothetical protein